LKSAKNVWLAKKSDFLEVGLKEDAITNFLNHRSRFDIKKYLDNLQKASIVPVTLSESDYPGNLKEISDAPYVLYVKGNLKNSDSRSVAIVGTRAMTSYGREVAHRLACELSNYGVTIISGLALGVDAEAQRSALNAGGRTISVLASGLDIISPLSNKALALQIIKGQGAVVSEYPLGHVPKPYEFPVRDRIISGLAKAVIVVEGRMKSGTFHTVAAASEQNRPVFAVPGPITSSASEGPNYLISQGARLITSAKDVLEELNLQFKVDSLAIEKVMPQTPLEKTLTNILDTEALHLDELVRISRLQTAQISATLTIMEMKGMVKNMGNGIYRKI
jgi:DNA processing protein